MMNLKGLMRAADTIGSLVDMTRRLRGTAPAPQTDLAVSGADGLAPGQLESRLAGVVVAALKEAFDRDRARLDLERAQIEAERQRAEEMLRLELLRQAADRAISQFRLLAAVAVLIWVTSAVVVMLVPGMRVGAGRLLLGAGWGALIAALGCAFAGHNQVAAWLAASRHPAADTGGGPPTVFAHVAPWLLVMGLALMGACFLLAG